MCFTSFQKHNRAMDVLYHLQQRQEQVLAVLDDELPEEEINGKKSSKLSLVTVLAVRLGVV